MAQTDELRAKNNGALVILLFLVWALALGGAFILWAITPPTDMGFTRGLNRVTPLFWGHMFALAFAIAAWIGARKLTAQNGLALLGRIPAYVMMGELVLLAAIILYAVITVPN